MFNRPIVSSKWLGDDSLLTIWGSTAIKWVNSPLFISAWLRAALKDTTWTSAPWALNWSLTAAAMSSLSASQRMSTLAVFQFSSICPSEGTDGNSSAIAWTIKSRTSAFRFISGITTGGVMRLLTSTSIGASANPLRVEPLPSAFLSGITVRIASAISWILALARVAGSMSPATPNSLATVAITSPALIESRFKSSSSRVSGVMLCGVNPVCWAIRLTRTVSILPGTLSVRTIASCVSVGLGTSGVETRETKLDSCAPLPFVPLAELASSGKLSKSARITCVRNAPRWER